MNHSYLRRYLDLPALIYLLRERKITLLDPRSWDDSNDSHYLALYREKKELKSVLALCFTQANETYHHWRIFAGGSSGVCVRFKRSSLLKATKVEPGLRVRAITYLTLDEIEKRTLVIEDLPFLKRYAFEDENEFRMIYESDTLKRPKLDIDIPLSCIDRITLSPWIHYDLFKRLKQVLRSIDGCSALSVVRSTLVSNEEWKAHGENAR
ncbi:MAG: DUF2971 domain-containing protein [Acidobacteriia bacterium]|nr:DUF2971 domain-containing protein [Terriglobia bacterium]